MRAESSLGLGELRRVGIQRGVSVRAGSVQTGECGTYEVEGCDGMARDGFVTVFVGGYEDAWAATRDFNAIEELHDDKVLGEYEAAVVKKEPSGEVVVSEVKTSTRSKGAAKGALAGGAIGVLFPPSVVGSAIVGTGAGLTASGMKKPLKRHDIKELGGLLREGRTGVVVVADAATDQALYEALPTALRRAHITVEPDAASIKAAINEVMTLDAATRL